MTDPSPEDLRGHPRHRIQQACAVHGSQEVARWCAELLTRQVAYDDPHLPSLTWLGGAHAATELRRGELEARGQDYWPRVWAARGLLHIWTPETSPAVVQALTDPAWRVREMAAKVVRRYEIGEAADRLDALLADDVPRVRAAALRALAVVGEAEHATAIRIGADDAEPAVRAAAVAALAELERRLDRPL
jgi:HEAT repeat protein